jgi:hypothetical protein
LVVIDTDCIVSYEFNYHTITFITSPNQVHVLCSLHHDMSITTNLVTSIPTHGEVQLYTILCDKVCH